jgi:hypothetical protein
MFGVNEERWNEQALTAEPSPAPSMRHSTPVKSREPAILKPGHHRKNPPPSTTVSAAVAAARKAKAWISGQLLTSEYVRDRRALSRRLSADVFYSLREKILLKKM